MRFTDETHLDYDLRLQFVFEWLPRVLCSLGYDGSKETAVITPFGWALWVPSKPIVKSFNRFDVRQGTWNAHFELSARNIKRSAVNWAENTLLELALFKFRKSKVVISQDSSFILEVKRDKRKQRRLYRDYRLKYEGRRHDFIKLIKLAAADCEERKGD